MSTPYHSKSGPQFVRTVELLPIEAMPFAHEYGVWCRKTNFHWRVVAARSAAAHAVCVPFTPGGFASITTKCALPLSNEK